MAPPSGVVHLEDDAIKLAEALAQAYVSGSSSATFDTEEVSVGSKTLTLTPVINVTVK